MERKYFPDNELNELPCAVIAFEKHEPWTILYANDKYYSLYSNGNTDTLNILADDEAIIKEFSKSFKGGDGSVSYRADCGVETKQIVMKVSLYNDNALLGVLGDFMENDMYVDAIENEKKKFIMALCNSKNVVFEHDLKTNKHVFYIPDAQTNTVKIIDKQGGPNGIPDDSIHPSHRSFFIENIYNPNEKMLSAKLRMPTDTEFKWYRVTRQFEYDENNELVMVYGLMADINDEKKKETERQREAEIDPSLNIYYRNAAVKRIEAYLKAHSDRRDFALFVIDIDNFKNINDTYGHLYGDTVIEMVANILKDIRPNFSVPGRYGGDEFFIFLYSADLQEIKDAANQILSKMAEFRIADGTGITSSIGIVTGDSFDAPPVYKDMFEKADRALYAAKNNGKAQWQIYNESMNKDSGRSITYEADDENNAAFTESKDLMKVFLELSSSAKTSEDAIYSIIKYITAKFDFDWMQVMQVNSHDDLITVRYEWSRDSEFHNNAGKSGYYVHSDIMKFRNYFEKHPVFEVIPANIEGFSPKFQREFDKNKDYNIIYVSDTTTDENFYMFTCIRFDQNQKWTKEEMDGLNIATKIMTMFIAQSGKETQREKDLQYEVDFDKKTGLYNMDRFYTQLGRLRKLAAENGDDIVVFHVDIGNMLNLNLKFGYPAGDAVIKRLAKSLPAGTDTDRNIFAHINGTDWFYCAFRVKKGDKTILDKYAKDFESFCAQVNNEYKDVNIVTRVGGYILPNGEDGGLGFDKAYCSKRQVQDRNKCISVWYEG